MKNKRSKLKGEIKHKVVGWNKGYYHKMYSIFCSYHGGTVPATHTSKEKGYVCGGCNKKLDESFLNK